ncbi:hypothetical protein, partial [Paenibacillus xylanexedens]|uniref:hypothetical protein n=1 Tax=Paenibacillus xylanexedens TaxID=528191 RepID=UPI001C92CA77
DDNAAWTEELKCALRINFNVWELGEEKGGVEGDYEKGVGVYDVNRGCGLVCYVEIHTDVWDHNGF